MTEQLDAPIGVLIVDDHRLFAESLARVLADELDIRVLGIAHDGHTALTRAAALHPQVALVESALPDQDGVVLTRDMKDRLPDTKVLMVTRSADDRLLIRAIEAGCSGFLTEESAAGDVADAVRRVIKGEALISPETLARLLPQVRPGRASVGHDLTGRELEILTLLAQGATNRAIASALSLSLNTIRNYVQSILTKLNAHSKLEAVSTAVREGLVEYQVVRRRA